MGKTTETSPYLFLIPLGLGLGALAIAVWFAWDIVEFRLHSTATVGQVVSLRESHDQVRGRDKRYHTVTTYWPTIEYHGIGKRAYQLEPGVSDDSIPKVVGASVPVRYDVEHPEIARVDTFSLNWGLQVLLPAIIGLVMIPIGWLIRPPAPTLGAGGSPSAALLRRRLAALPAKSRDWLQEHGTEVWATVVRTEGSRLFGSTLVIAQWSSEHGKPYEFAGVADASTPQLYKGDRVRVLIDPNKPATHWMDFASRPAAPG